MGLIMRLGGVYETRGDSDVLQSLSQKYLDFNIDVCLKATAPWAVWSIKL